MGGTFDPVHTGHLIIAENARISFDLDEIIFIPTGRPAHKVENGIADNQHRYEMVLLAINSNPHFSISPMEMEREGFTYTIDTIKYLRSKNPDTEYYFIMGLDSLYNFHKWKDYQELLSLCKFIVAKRPIQDNNKIEEKIRQLHDIYPKVIEVLESPIMDISSTDIRERISLNKSIKYLVPESVEKYIEKHQLYGGDTNDWSLDS